MAEQVQLKVCEGCGVLWVRPMMLRGVYCARCYGKLRAFPKVADLRKRGPKRQVTLPQIHAVAVAGGAR